MRRADGGLAAGSAVGAIGAALAALAGALCCAGPAVIAVVGVSGAIAAAKLEPYRPYLLGVSVVFLAFGFWRAYRAVPVDGGAAAPRTGRWVRVALWAGAVITLVSAIAPRLA